MRIAIHQPNYLPWYGFFDKMTMVDVFVIYDDAQMPQGKTYASRVKIPMSNGTSWLTVPTQKHGGAKRINEVKIAKDPRWQRKHWKTIKQTYGKTGGFKRHRNIFREIYYDRDWESLLWLNIDTIITLAMVLGIETRIKLSSPIGDPELHGAERIFNIIETLGADTYVSGRGKGSVRYIDPREFEKRNIKLVWQDYEGPVVSAIDKVFV
jgi:hypothetical protein